MDRMIGKTPVGISEDRDNDTITFSFSNGDKAVFYHDQDCCERVSIEDVNGDWADLLNTPLLVAEMRTVENPTDAMRHDASETWTFYTFRSIKGSVDARWVGSSNGYYSEGVDFFWTEGSRV